MSTYFDYFVKPKYLTCEIQCLTLRAEPQLQWLLAPFAQLDQLQKRRQVSAGSEWAGCRPSVTRTLGVPSRLFALAACVLVLSPSGRLEA